MNNLYKLLIFFAAMTVFLMPLIELTHVSLQYFDEKDLYELERRFQQLPNKKVAEAEFDGMITGDPAQAENVTPSPLSPAREATGSVGVKQESYLYNLRNRRTAPTFSESTLGLGLNLTDQERNLRHDLIYPPVKASPASWGPMASHKGTLMDHAKKFADKPVQDIAESIAFEILGKIKIRKVKKVFAFVSATHAVIKIQEEFFPLRSRIISIFVALGVVGSFCALYFVKFRS